MKRSKLKSKGRAAKHGTFNGSTCRLFDRISNGLGKSYLLKQAEIKQLQKNGGLRRG